MKNLDSLVTTPHGHAPVGPPRDQNWVREPECRFQNAIQGNLRTPPPFLCAWVTPARGLCVRHGLEQEKVKKRLLLAP